MQHQSGDDIGVFLAVCEAGSFIGASSRLRLSASAVAKAVSRLENRLHVRLFLRTTRRLSLTAEGLAYRDVCRKARTEIEHAETVIAGLSRQPAGMVRISLPPLLGARIVAPALYSLARQWPDLEFGISTSTETINMLDGSVDLAVRIGEVPDVSGLMARQLGMQRIVLCASSAYFADRPVPMTIEELSGHEVIGTWRKGVLSPWRFRQDGGEIVNWHPQARLLLDGSLLTLSAVSAGHGLGLLPRWLVRDELEAGRLVSVLDDRIAGHLPIHAIWPASPVMLPRLRVAIDAIVEATRSLLVDGELR